MSVSSLEEYEERLNKLKQIQPYEIVHVVALLIARAILFAMVLPNTGRLMKMEIFLGDHFGDSFEAIMQLLHFNNNGDEEARRDKAWKIRPLLHTVEETFRRGYRLGKVISFDEGMMSNRIKFNSMRVLMPDKPGKYGTKLYVTCCAETAYCSRVEIYCGADKNKKQKEKEKTNHDTLGLGPLAVMSNISKTLAGQLENDTSPRTASTHPYH